MSRTHALAAENLVHGAGSILGARCTLCAVECKKKKKILHNMFHSNINEDRTFIFSHLSPSADGVDVWHMQHRMMGVDIHSESSINEIN